MAVDEVPAGALPAIAPAIATTSTNPDIDEPATGAQSGLTAAAWLLLAVAGWLVQRRALQPAAGSSA